MSDYKYEAIEVLGIAEDDIVKKADQTAYRIPFVLNTTPHTLWEILLNKRWESCSGGSIYCEDKRIVLEQEEIDDLEELRTGSLKPVVEETNRDFKKLMENTKVKTNAIFR